MSVGTFDARLFHTQDGEWQVIDWRSRVQDPVLRSGVGNARKRSRRKQRGNWKDSTRQTESSDRDARATRRVVGKRLTPWRRPAPPDAAHAPCLKELAHPSSQCRLKTTVTSSFLTRNLWNPSSLCSLYQTFFSPLSPLSLSLSLLPLPSLQSFYPSLSLSLSLPFSLVPPSRSDFPPLLWSVSFSLLFCPGSTTCRSQFLLGQNSRCWYRRYYLFRARSLLDLSGRTVKITKRQAPVFNSCSIFLASYDDVTDVVKILREMKDRSARDAGRSRSRSLRWWKSTNKRRYCSDNIQRARLLQQVQMTVTLSRNILHFFTRNTFVPCVHIRIYIRTQST